MKKELDALLCDYYHLTMIQALYRSGKHETEETFELYYRKNPFKGGYVVTAGLGEALEWINDWHFSDENIDFLRAQKTLSGAEMFDEDFLAMLKNTSLALNIDAMPEGEIAFPNEPIVRVSGPSWQCHLMEAALLNIINSHSLIATKASRIVAASMCDGKKRSVLEFGLRRAQDIGGFMPVRAAYVGGAEATSNVEAGAKYGIPVRGTHAHSFIMHYENELDAFVDYMKAMPENTTLLVDTYDTLNGVKNAIKAAQITGISLMGIRLDSGDLTYLSIEARKLLDEAGFVNTKIVASNDLDEHIIESLIKNEGAKIDIFGVGTNLVTAADQPALGGVYKLKTTAGRDCIKVSDQVIKTTIPGATDVLRILKETENGDEFNGDVIIKSGGDFKASGTLTSPLVSINMNNGFKKVFPSGTKYYKPLKRVVSDGKVEIAELEKSLPQIKAFAEAELAKLEASHKRLSNPHTYVAGLEQSLWEQREAMRLEKQNVH